MKIISLKMKSINKIFNAVSIGIKNKSGIVLILAILGSFTVQLSAKEMTHRLGLGPKAPFSVGIPAMALHYFPNMDYALTGAIGINTEKDYSRFGFQVGLRRILFEENNMNFFVGGALGLIGNEVAGVNQSGFELLATAGGEFFFLGIDNLGFNFETGVGVASLKSSNRFYTIASSPMSAGIIFYF